MYYLGLVKWNHERMPHPGFTKEFFPFGVAGLVRGVCGLLKSILMPSSGKVKGLELKCLRNKHPLGLYIPSSLGLQLLLQAEVSF